MNPQPSPLVIALAVAGGVALGLVIASRLAAPPPESAWKKMAREGVNAAIGGAAYAVAARILG